VKDLLDYLDASGWTQTKAGTRRIEKDGWVYDWQAGSWSDLWRWKPDRTGSQDIEVFIIRDEHRAIEIGKKIMTGEHLPPPDFDHQKQRKIAVID